MRFCVGVQGGQKAPAAAAETNRHNTKLTLAMLIKQRALGRGQGGDIAGQGLVGEQARVLMR